MKGAFLMLNQIKSPTLSLLFLSSFMTESFFVQVYPDLSFFIFVNIFRRSFWCFCSKMHCILMQCLEWSWYTFLRFSFWNTETWSPWWFGSVFLQFVLSVHYALQIAWCCSLLGRFSPRRWESLFLYQSVWLFEVLLSH